MTSNWTKRTRNRIYGIDEATEKFKSEYPDEEIIIISATTARMMETKEDFKLRLNWLSPQRGTVILTEKRIYFRDWMTVIENLKYADITIVPIAFSSKICVIRVADADQSLSIRRK